jgi:hypothetical protein
MRVVYLIYPASGSHDEYIGKTHQPWEKYCDSHIVAARNGSDRYVHRWLRKINFRVKKKILEIVTKSRSLEKAERKWIKHYRGIGWRLKNLTDGGENIPGWHQEMSVRKRLQKSKLGKKNPMFGKPAVNRGTHPTIETRKKQRKAKLGTHPSEKTRTKMRRAHLGFTHTLKSKKKISKGRRKYLKTHKNTMWKRKHTDATKKKMSKSAMGNQNGRKYKK